MARGALICLGLFLVVSASRADYEYVSVEEDLAAKTGSDRHFKVGHGPHHMKIHLTKIDANDHPFTVISGEEDGNKFSTSYVEDGDTYYVNAADGHSVVINDAGLMPTMHGILNGTKHIGHAVGDSHRNKRVASLPNAHFFEDARDAGDVAGFKDDERFKSVIHTDFRQKRQAAASPPSWVFPEVYAVVDYNLFKVLARSDAQIQRYIRVVYNGVNNAYAQITNPRFVIRIKGIFICKTTSACYFIENIKRNGQLNADSALGGIDDWGYSQLATFGKFDVMMVHTSLDLCTGTGTSCTSTSVAGLATVDGACDRGRPGTQTIKNAGIAEDEGAYNGIKTIAHEMGHLMGAVHDGERASNSQQTGAPGASSCPWSSSYIMGNAGFSINQFTWSSCSIRQLTFFALSTEGQCLWNNIDLKPQFSLINDLPGKILSYDQQCKILFGTNAKECPTSSRTSASQAEAEKCLALKCQVSGTQWSWSCKSVSNPPADGTTCATGKYCLDGKCVCDPTSRSCSSTSNFGQNTPPPGLRPITEPSYVVTEVDDTSISWGGKGCAEVVADYWGRQQYCNSAGFNKYCLHSRKQCVASEAAPCEDSPRISFNGKSCTALLSGGTFWDIRSYCEQANVQSYCCASHKRYCSASGRRGATTPRPSSRTTRTTPRPSSRTTTPPRRRPPPPPPTSSCADNAGAAWGRETCRDIAQKYWGRYYYCDRPDFKQHCCQSRQHYCIVDEPPECSDNGYARFGEETCAGLFRHGFWSTEKYCGNPQIQLHCCASHRRNCNQGTDGSPDTLLAGDLNGRRDKSGSPPGPFRSLNISVLILAVFSSSFLTFLSSGS